MAISRIVRQATRNGKKYNVNAAIGSNGGNRAILRSNRTKNPVTQGANEPNVRIDTNLPDVVRRTSHSGGGGGSTLPVRSQGGPKPWPEQRNTGGGGGGRKQKNNDVLEGDYKEVAPKLELPPPPKAEASGWRGIEDIKNTVKGQAPLTTFFRNREARDKMMASGQGAKYEWEKGSTSIGRVAATAGGAYAAIDTIDRAGSGGSITRNETGRFDMMGIPIL